MNCLKRSISGSLLVALAAAPLAAQEPSSIVFLVPMSNKARSLAEFDKNFTDLGYDIVIVSDYYGLRGLSNGHVKVFLRRLFDNARKFELRTGHRPRFVLDVEGFRLAKDREIREMCRKSPYVFGYHVKDEPDAHKRGDPNKWAATPEEIDKLLTGLGPWKKPLFMTFENQAGKPENRRWNYINNTDKLYLKYMSVVNKHHEGTNYFGIDYYLFNRSLTPPKDQLSSFRMMSYFADLVRQGSPKARAFAWTEPTLQGLGYICQNPKNHSRAVTPEELWAQFWLYWAAGQRGLRGDFNYIFNHRCQGKKSWNPDGLNHGSGYYAENKKVVQRANALQREVSSHLGKPAVVLPTSNPMVKASARFYIDEDRFRIFVIAVNVSSHEAGKVAILGHPVLHKLGVFRVLGEKRDTTFDEAGFLADDFGAYGVHLYELK